MNTIKFYIWILGIGVTILASCQQEITPSTKYEELKKVSYTSMTNGEKLFFRKELSSQLKADPDYKAAVVLLDAQTNALREASRTRLASGSKREAIDKDLPRLERLKKRGIKNPAAFERDQLLFVIKMRAVSRKFPELKQLSKAVRTQIFKNAS